MDIIGLIPQFGGALYTIAAFVIALSVIVAVHEFGHYIVGRWSGIDAEVFSLGFGPVLWSRMDKRGTRWQVAALPLGGYVKFLGDADAASGKDAEAIAQMDEATRRRTVHAAPLWARAATVAAGPVFNFILSILVFGGVILWQGVASNPMTVAEIRDMPGMEQGQGLMPGDVVLTVAGHEVPEEASWNDFLDALPQTPLMDYEIRRDGQLMTVAAPHILPALVGGVSSDSAALTAGLAEGDVVQAVDGTPIYSFAELRDMAGKSDGSPMDLTIWRAGDVRDYTLAPRSVDLPTDGGGFETRWLLGVTSTMLFQPETQSPSLWDASKYGVKQTWAVVQSSISGLYHMAAGAISSCNLRGPIGIAQTSGDAASQGGLSFIWFIAVFSTAVGLLNLFPIPVLDGGHLVFHAWEALTGKPPGDRAMRIMMTIGLTLILMLMAFALSNDIRCP